MWGQTSLALSQLQTEMSNTGAIEQINSSISGQSVQIEGANLENDEGTVISLSQQLAPGINSSFLGSVWGNWNTPTGTQAKQTAIQDGMNSSFNQLVAATQTLSARLETPNDTRMLRADFSHMSTWSGLSRACACLLSFRL